MKTIIKLYVGIESGAQSTSIGCINFSAREETDIVKYSNLFGNVSIRMQNIKKQRVQAER